MSLGSWYVSRGRIDRSTYWLRYFLPITAVGLVLALVVTVAARPAASADTYDGSPNRAGVLAVFFLVWLAVLTPAISSQVTRLHDTGRSAWWMLLGLVPFGGIALLVFLCLEGQPHPNQWGPPTTTPPGSGYPYPGYPQQGYGQQGYGQHGYGQQ